MGPVGPVALNEVLLVLERFLLEVAVPPPSQRYGKVLAAPIGAARGLSFEAVFVPGLAEKMFPRKIVEEPILLDAVREQIGESLVTNQSRLEAERLAMALAAGAAERRICFSYPRLDLDQARPRVPSFYALEAVRAAEGVLPDFAELARRAETATTARLGWPAPPNPADAIDQAEHDLAVLDSLEARPEESPGAARYLVTVNPHLARALRARRTLPQGRIRQPGRPRGARNKVTVAVESLMGEYGPQVAARVIKRACEGDMTAARLILERIAPLRRGHPVHLKLPEISDAVSVMNAHAAPIST
jgi:hypothetical protein